MEETTKSKKKKIWIYLLLLLLLLFSSVFVITYALFKNFGVDNPIDTGNVVFTYSDVDQRGNGIYIDNAIPIKDSTGKIAVGNQAYFDFNVTFTTGKVTVIYTVLATKESGSTLDESDMKIYLTKLNGTIETPVQGVISEGVVKTYDQLQFHTDEVASGRVLHEEVTNGEAGKISDHYRLRMWLREDSEDYFNKQFSVKINIFATSKS